MLMNYIDLYSNLYVRIYFFFLKIIFIFQYLNILMMIMNSKIIKINKGLFQLVSFFNKYKVGFISEK